MGACERKDPRDWIAIFRRANDVLREETGVPDLSASWVQIFLFVAEQGGQPLSAIERAVGMRTTSAQRAVQALSFEDRNGRDGLGLIEDVVDPRHGSRKLYFLSQDGQRVMTSVLNILTGEKNGMYPAETGGEFLHRLALEQAERPPLIDLKAFTPQEVATGKRSLARKKVVLGPHVVAFPLAPAASMIDDMRTWVKEVGGELYSLTNVGKPNGMVIVDLPNKQTEIFFRLRWLR